MTVLKWLLIVVSIGYAGGLVALFFAQRSFLFPVPTVARTSPQQAGFPEAEEHILDTADGEKVIVWYAPVQSLDTYSQANARIVRPGQTAKTLICHLVGTAVERVTYARLKSRDNMQGLLLALFRHQELEF